MLKPLTLNCYYKPKITYRDNPFKMNDGKVSQINEEMSDDLKNNVSKTPAQAIICYECSLPIRGVIVKAMDQTWHPEHFCCSHCKKPISGQRFNIEDDKPYCVDDYSQLFLKRCNGCNLPIRDVVVVALNKYWHLDHFVCVTCGTRLSNNGFYERENNPFCQTCYQDKFCPKCRECNMPIMSTAIMALGDKWHEECFKCTRCNKPICDPTFELYDGKQVCEICVKSDEFKIENIAAQTSPVKVNIQHLNEE